VKHPVFSIESFLVFQTLASRGFTSLKACAYMLISQAVVVVLFWKH
jgi:hypothetical protein